MSESTQQQDLVYWFRSQYPDKIIFAIPNGAWLPVANKARRMAYTAMRKREGLLPGVSDLFIPESVWHTDSEGYPVLRYGLFLEMKDVGKTQCAVTLEQKWFLEEMRRRGYVAEWAAGFDHAQAIIKNYMECN